MSMCVFVSLSGGEHQESAYERLQATSVLAATCYLLSAPFHN